MNFIPIKYTSVIFGNFQDITPQPAIVEKLFPSMIRLGLMPSTTANEFDISKNQIIQSLKFADSKNSISIFFRFNAIHIELFPSAYQNTSLDEFATLAKQILKNISEQFSREFNRLSLVVSYLDDSISNTNKDSLYDRVFPSTKSLLDAAPYEWSHRLVSRVPLVINKKQETCNQIITLLRGNGQQVNVNPFQQPSKVNRIELTIDNNTIPDATGYRFTTEDYDVFIDLVLEKQKDIYKKILERISHKNG